MITNLYITSAGILPGRLYFLVGIGIASCHWGALYMKLFQEVRTSDTHRMLQPPTSSSVSDTNFHTNLFGKCVHLMPSPVTVRKRNRMWNEATSVRTRWGFQKHLSKKVASWSGWMSPNEWATMTNDIPWSNNSTNFVPYIVSLSCNPNPSRFLDIFLSIWICFSFWNPA